MGYFLKKNVLASFSNFFDPKFSQILQYCNHLSRITSYLITTRNNIRVNEN
jgi:hypothetical protein